MHVGVCKLRLRLPENQSLKGKRQILHSILDRVKNSYNVSIAEVEDHDLWQVATLGIACVSNSTQRANEIISKVVDFISKGKFDLEMLDYEIEMVNIF